MYPCQPVVVLLHQPQWKFRPTIRFKSHVTRSDRETKRYGFPTMENIWFSAWTRNFHQKTFSNFKAFNRDSTWITPARVSWKKEPDDVNLSFTANYLSTACRVGGKVGVRASRKYETGYVSRRNIVGLSVRPKRTVYIESAFNLLSPRHLIHLPFSVHSFVPADSADDVSSGASSVAVKEIKIRPIAGEWRKGPFHPDETIPWRGRFTAFVALTWSPPV